MIFRTFTLPLSPPCPLDQSTVANGASVQRCHPFEIYLEVSRTFTLRGRFDLFISSPTELDAPHDSPSLTLARLRVSEEVDGEDRRSYVPNPSPRGQYAGPSHRGPQEYYNTSQTYQHNDNRRYNHNRPPPTLFHAYRSELEGRHSLAVQSPAGYPDNRRRESYSSHDSMNINTRPYTSQEWTSQYYRLDTTNHHEPSAPSYVNATYPPGGHRSPSSIRDRSYSSGYPSSPQEIYTNIPSMRDTVDEQTPLARHHSSNPRGIPYSQQTPEDNTGTGSMKYECSYCGKGFNRPSSLKV